MQRRRPGEQYTRLEELVIGNSSHKDYLMAGYSGNAAGARYEVGAPVLGR